MHLESQTNADWPCDCTSLVFHRMSFEGFKYVYQGDIHSKIVVKVRQTREFKAKP